jgi:hypothetical protein
MARYIAWVWKLKCIKVFSGIKRDDTGARHIGRRRI